MLPHHKAGAINRTITRIGALANDIERKKLRGRSREEIRTLVDFYRDRTYACFDRVDIRISSMRMQEDGNPFCNFAFKCLECGHDTLSFPDDFATDKAVICAGCKRPISSYGDMESALKFLAYDEFHHGQPDKFLQQGADNERPPTNSGAGQMARPALQVELEGISLRQQTEEKNHPSDGVRRAEP